MTDEVEAKKPKVGAMVDAMSALRALKDTIMKLLNKTALQIVTVGWQP
jgi:hypothetical protein